MEIFGFHIHKNECGFLKLGSECSDCTVSFRVLYPELRRSIPESWLILDTLVYIHTDKIVRLPLKYDALSESSEREISNTEFHVPGNILLPIRYTSQHAVYKRWTSSVIAAIFNEIFRYSYMFRPSNKPSTSHSLLRSEKAQFAE